MPSQEQDPLDKYFNKSAKQTNDPLDKYFRESKVETLKNEEIKEEEIIKELAQEESWWDWATRSRLPERLSPSGGINYENKNPLTVGQVETGAEPDTYAGGFAKGLQESLYGSIVRPISSPLGAAITVGGGPLIRSTLGIASRIPGVSKLGNLLNKEILPGKAPSFVKKTVESLTPKGKVSTGVDTSPEITPPIAEPPSIITKLHKALDESKPLNEEQAKILTSERAEKFGEAGKVSIDSAEGAKKFMSNLAGEHTKVQMEPLKLDENDVTSLYSMIGDALKADTIDVPRAAQSITGLRKLLEGGVPVPSEIETLEKVFGSGIAEKFPQTITNRQAIIKAINIPKALVSAIDIGFPFRHGINRVGQKEWFGMLRPAIESWASEAAETEWMNAIKAHPRYDLMKRAGLPLGGKVGGDREETILASVFSNQKAKNKFGKGVLWLENKVANSPGVRHSNRGHNIASAKIRSDLFESQYQDYNRLYQTTKNLAGDNDELLKAAEALNPDNLYRAKQIADLVATSTGRGSLERLEPIAQELNSSLFAPRLMSARFKTLKRILNPASYVQADPIQRKDTLKQMLSLTGTLLATGAMFKAGGGEVELDPWNSDFGKGRIGNTRFDMGGGYLQYIVPFAKVMRSLAGKPVESTRGGEYMLGEKYGSPDRLDVLTRFLTNRSSPLGSLFISLMRGKEPSGKDIDLSNLNPMENTIMKSFIPIIAQDTKELVEEDPNLLPLLIPSMFGGNVEVHDETPFSSSIGRRRR